MSWITQHLLRNKTIIRGDNDIESDAFNDLLVVEAKVKELHKKGILSDSDLHMLEMASDGRSLKKLGDSTGVNRPNATRSFIQVCDILSYFLGGDFTDEGFIEHMRKDYNLSDEDISKLKSHIDSKYRHKLIRSPK